MISLCPRRKLLNDMPMKYTYSHSLAKHYRQLLAKSPELCKYGLFTQVGELVTVINSECNVGLVSNVRHLIVGGCYNDAQRLGDWDKQQDAIVWYVVCTEEGNVLIVEVYSPVDYAIEDAIIHWWKVPTDESGNVLSFISTWVDIAQKTWWERVKLAFHRCCSGHKGR